MGEVEDYGVEARAAQTGSVGDGGRAEPGGVDGVKDGVAIAFEGGDVGGRLGVLGEERGFGLESCGRQRGAGIAGVEGIGKGEVACGKGGEELVGCVVRETCLRTG